MTGSGRPALGVVEALAAATLWGASGIFSVHLFRLGVSPGAVALLRPAIALALLVGLLAVFRPRALRVERGPPGGGTDVRGLLFLALVGGAAVTVFQIAYQMSIDAVGVPSTVAMVFLAPSIVVATSGPVLGEWPSRRRVALAALVAAGVWLSVLGAGDAETSFGASGVVWGLAAAVGYAGYTLFGRHAARIWGPFATTVYSTAGACLMLAAVVPLAVHPVTLPASTDAWLLLGVYAFATITVAQFLFYDALTRADASRVSIAAAAEPVVAAVLATVLLAQGLDPLGWLGITLVVGGVVGVALDRGAPVAPTGSG